MFKRNEKGNLRFSVLNFEVLIGDFLEETPPKDMNELRWAIAKMIESILTVGDNYTKDNFEGEEWEDVFYPADFF